MNPTRPYVELRRVHEDPLTCTTAQKHTRASTKTHKYAHTHVCVHVYIRTSKAIIGNTGAGAHRFKDLKQQVLSCRFEVLLKQKRLSD